MTYQPGTLLAVGRKGSVTVRHQLRTAGSAKSIVLRPDKESLVVDGADAVFIEVGVVDSAGTVVPTAQNWIDFSAEGFGRLWGGTTKIDADTGVAAINVQSTGKAGEIVVKATSLGLSSASLRVEAEKRGEGRK